jgi:hypothetical protein
MKKTEKKLIEKEEITDFICNKCGKSFYKNFSKEGISFSGCGEYGSSFDGYVYSFDLCDLCCKIFFDSFFSSIPVEKEQYFF